MIEDAAKQVYGVFSRRFVFNALLPTSIFMSLTLGLVTLTVAEAAEVMTWWTATPLFTQILLALSYAGAVLFVSAVVASQWRGIVRLFEGYPLGRLARKVNRRAFGVHWHGQRMRDLRDPKSPEYRPHQAFYRYPHKRHAPDLLPSRLGNILLAGERYPYDRYGADAIVFWPRLYPLLPARFQNDYLTFVINYQFPLVVSIEAAVATVICATAIFVDNGPAWLFLLVFFTGMLLSYAAYVASLSGAVDLAEQHRTAFDLFRADLIAAWPDAIDVQDERQAFLAINKFVVLDAKPQWRESVGLTKRRAAAMNLTIGPPPGQ